jgi:hypothetical protein
LTEKEIEDVLGWGLKNRIWRGGRNTHQVYVKDVAAGVLHCVKLHDAGLVREGAPTTFILSNDNEKDNRYSKLLTRFYKARGLPGWLACPILAPRWLERLKDRLKYRRWKIGYPSGSAIYSPDKLLATGFKHPHGIISVQDRVIGEMVSRSKAR